MSIFNPGLTLESLNTLSANTQVSHLGIEFTRIGDDFIEAKMPVDARPNPSHCTIAATKPTKKNPVQM